jgi:hypothetical protein
MVFYIKEIKKKIFSFLLIGKIEDKYAPYKNQNLDDFCYDIVNCINEKIFINDYNSFSNFYIVSKNKQLTINIMLNETFNKKIYLLGKIILRKNNKVKKLKYILFNNKLKLNKLYEIRKEQKNKLFCKKKNIDNINYYKLVDLNNVINNTKEETHKLLINFIRQKIYNLYCTT